MPEVVGTFPCPELWHERADCSVETRNGPLRDLAQQSLEFAVGHLDGIEVGRILRQVTKYRLCLLNRLPDACDLVDSAVVHHHDVAAAKHGNQALLDVGQEHLSVHGPFDHHRGGHLIMTQRRHEGDCLPLAKRDAADQSDTARNPSPEPHHIGADGGLVDKYQPGGIKHALLSNPASTRPGHVGSLAFRGTAESSASAYPGKVLD